MRSRLTLTNPLWNRQKRRALLDRAVQQSGVELEKEIKSVIIESQPRGRTYRRGAITRAATKKNSGFRRSKGNTKKVIVGSEFHRASAPGQPPARDTSGLINSIRARKTGEMKAQVDTSKAYAAALDDGTEIAGRKRNVVIKPRPFFKSTAKKFLPKFKQNIQKAIDEAKKG